MIYIVRRNFRHNGKLYMQGSKPDIAVLDEVMRMNVKAGVLVPLAAKPEVKKPDGKKHEEPKKVDDAKKPEAEAKADAKKPGIMDKIGSAIGDALGKKDK
jgi:hypothetical protein